MEPMIAQLISNDDNKVGLFGRKFYVWLNIMLNN